MQGVMDFLREQELKAQDREMKLVAEKRMLEERVKNLEDELQKQI
jgi:cell division protein FtsB